MKKKSHEQKIALIAVGVLAVALLPWFVFKPLSAVKILNDTLAAFDSSDRFGEACRVYVKDVEYDGTNPTQETLDIRDIVSGFSVEVASHVLPSQTKAYRLMQSSSVLDTTDDERESPRIVFEMIRDGAKEYVRYDTKGPWISFPHEMLADMGEYIRKMFRNEWYHSLNDIKRESLKAEKNEAPNNKHGTIVFRGAQTEQSLGTARELFEFPSSTYTMADQYADVIIDSSSRSIVKTVLYTLFDYYGSEDDSQVLHIPVYQECTPVNEKDLEVHAPSNILPATREQVQQYLLFKVLPLR